jgi:putative transposase
MADSHDARLAELVGELGGDDVRFLFRDLVQGALQELIDAELTEAIGARPHERTETRINQRNGGRTRVLSTPAGDVELRIPKVREGAFFPSLLEPRRRVDRALWAVIMTAHVTTSTRKVDDLVKALGVESGISPSTVSRICEQLDEEVGAFRDRSLDHIEFPKRVRRRHLSPRAQGPPGGIPVRSRLAQNPSQLRWNRRACGVLVGAGA